MRAGAGTLTRRGVPRVGDLLRAAAISARAGSRALSPK
ncbi:MAG: hypothetical protein QOK25_2725, partial [Thermoleophilaceae bacterium]|nr:hypothetical protein [Thermoleophilaceae bacterium]